MRAKRKVVVPFRGAMPAHGVPHSEVVAFLNDLLKQAKSGAITGIAAAWVGPAQSVHVGWSSGMADRHDMVAAVDMLHFRILSACVTGLDPVQ